MFQFIVLKFNKKPSCRDQKFELLYFEEFEENALILKLINNCL